MVTHSATFDFWPETRHALRATPHGEKPTSVADYEKQTGKQAQDRQVAIWKQKGIIMDKSENKLAQVLTKRGYND